MRSLLLICSVALIGLGGCGTTDSSKSDFSIRLVPGADGHLVAVPAPCPSWATTTPDPLDNGPWPQYGCASARNLAAVVERPEDLIRGRDWGDASGEQTASAMRRYVQDKTYPMIDPSKDSEEGPVASATSVSSRTTTNTGGGAAPAAGAVP